jgi:small subunit ribosomal protein S10
MNTKIYKLKISTSNIFNFFRIKSLIFSLKKKTKVVILPKITKRFVLIRSPHVNKKSKEHFQITKYRRLYYLNFSKNALKLFLLKIPNDVNVLIMKNS